MAFIGWAVQSSAESYSKLNEAEAQAVIEALKHYMEEQQPFDIPHPFSCPVTGL